MSSPITHTNDSISEHIASEKSEDNVMRTSGVGSVATDILWSGSSLLPSSSHESGQPHHSTVDHDKNETWRLTDQNTIDTATKNSNKMNAMMGEATDLMNGLRVSANSDLALSTSKTDNISNVAKQISTTSSDEDRMRGKMKSDRAKQAHDRKSYTTDQFQYSSSGTYATYSTGSPSGSYGMVDHQYAPQNYASPPYVQKVMYPVNSMMGYYSSDGGQFQRPPVSSGYGSYPIGPGYWTTDHVMSSQQVHTATAYFSKKGEAMPQESRQSFKVEFKAGRTEIYSGPTADGFVSGDFVIVEADRGKDLGLIVSQVAGPDAGNGTAKQTAGASGLKLSDFKKILRRALPSELLQLSQKAEDEENALELCRQKAEVRKMDIELTQAEFQFDRRKLTFLFKAQSRIDFRGLIRDIFKVYKTRIWMKQYGAGSEHFKADKSAKESVMT